MAHSRATKDRFMELRAEGMSFDRIHAEIDVSKQTLIKWSKDLKLQIADLQAARVDEMVEKYLLAKEHRISLFAEQIMRLRDELEGRDLTELSVKEVLSLYLRYLKGVSREIEPLQVDVSVTAGMERYREILVECMDVPEGLQQEDIPALADEIVKQSLARYK